MILPQKMYINSGYNYVIHFIIIPLQDAKCWNHHGWSSLTIRIRKITERRRTSVQYIFLTPRRKTKSWIPSITCNFDSNVHVLLVPSIFSWRSSNHLWGWHEFTPTDLLLYIYIKSSTVQDWRRKNIMSVSLLRF